MFEVIKGSNPANSIIIDGNVKIDIGSAEKPVKDLRNEAEDSANAQEENTAEKADSNLITITQEELDSIRAQYRMDGENYAEEMRLKTEMEFAKAKVQVSKLIEDAEGKASQILASAEERVNLAAEDGRKQGYEKGYNEGYNEGYGKGNADGYTHTVNEGRAAVQDLKNLCLNIERERNDLMAENRRAIFDLSMGIAQKITMAVLNQKDKSVLQKMITNAAKEFRKAKRVKVTVSRLDLSDDVETDLNTFERCFSPTTEVEFEVLDDGEKGTLQIETDSEILDAAVSTQLRMIEELGSGKYRDKEPDKSADDSEEAAEKAIDVTDDIIEEPIEVKNEEKTEIKSEVKAESKSEAKPKKKVKTEAKKEEKGDASSLQTTDDTTVKEDKDVE